MDICTSDFQPHSLQMLTSKPSESPSVRLVILISILRTEQLRNDGTSSRLLLVGRPDSRKLIISAQTAQTHDSLAYQRVPYSSLRWLEISQRDGLK